MIGLGLTSDWIIEKVAQVSLANHVAKLMQMYFSTLYSNENFSMDISVLLYF